MPLTDYDYTDSLNNMFRDSLNELVQVLRVSKDRGGVILAGVSGDIASYALEKELEKELKDEWMFETVKWESDLKDLAELFPAGDPSNTLYFVEGLKVNANAIAMLNMTREFYSKEKKTVVYRLSPDVIFKELQWKAADFWSFRTATFNFFMDDDYFYNLQKKVFDEMENQHRVSFEIDFYMMLLEREKSKETPGQKSIAYLSSILGLFYYLSGDLSHSLIFSREALEIDRKLGDKKAESYDLILIGRIYRTTGELKKGQTCLQKSLEIAREIGYKKGEIDALCEIGRIFSELNQMEESLTISEQALEKARKLNDEQRELTQLTDIGIFYSNLKQPDKAISYHQKALEISIRSNSKAEEGIQYFGIGRAYYDLDRLEEALSQLLEALEISKQLDYKLLEVDSRFFLGKTYNALGQPKKALSHLQTALDFYQKIGNKTQEKEIQKTIREIKKEK